MFNRKIEGGSRSEHFFRAAVYSTLHLENNTFYPAVDTKSLDLAYLFAEEERLETLITESSEARPLGQLAQPKLVDRETIDKIITVARKIAKAGYPLRLVSADEMLDIAQIFSTIPIDLAKVFQKLDYDTQKTLSEFSRRIRIQYYEPLIPAPYPQNAYTLILNEIVGSLHETGNSVWTARTAAGLAYFSALAN